MLVHNLVHLGYALMLCALLARDVLWLRIFLAVGQANLSLYSYFRGIDSIAAWNALFVVINSAWIARILHERRAVQLPAELAELHRRYFVALSAGELLRVWGWGERCTLSDAVLTRHGEPVPALYFLLRGVVVVRQGGHEVTRLGAGDFVAEMGLLTGAAASADAQTAGAAELMRWPAARLQQVRARDPALWSKIQSVLGRDLVAKIQRASAVPVAGVGDVSAS